MMTSRRPSRRIARIKPSVFLRGSILPTDNTKGSDPHRSWNHSGEAVPKAGRTPLGTTRKRGHARQLEPFARLAEEVDQPGRLEPVGPRAEQADPYAQRLEMASGLDQLILAATRGLEGEAGRVQEDRTGRAVAPAARRQPGRR